MIIDKKEIKWFVWQFHVKYQQLTSIIICEKYYVSMIYIKKKKTNKQTKMD